MLAEVGSQLPMARVHFLGGLPYEDYLRVMQLSSCHVYLTYPFVLSWSCAEAMSAGRVVVASRTGPVTEVIEHSISLMWRGWPGRWLKCCRSRRRLRAWA